MSNPLRPLRGTTQTTIGAVDEQVFFSPETGVSVFNNVKPHRESNQKAIYSQSPGIYDRKGSASENGTEVGHGRVTHGEGAREGGFYIPVRSALRNKFRRAVEVHRRAVRIRGMETAASSKGSGQTRRMFIPGFINSGSSTAYVQIIQ